MKCSNSDVHVHWRDIIEVRIHSPTPVLCADCCDRPFLPRMGPCGHVFCFPCIWVRIAFQHQDRKETCPICNRRLRKMELRRVRTFISYTPKVNDVVQFRHLLKDDRSINLFPLNHLSLAYRFNLLNAKDNDFVELLRKDIASMEKYMAGYRNAEKDSVLFSIAEDIVAFLRLYEGLLLDNETKSNDVTFSGCSAAQLRRNPKFFLELYSQDTFLHAYNRRCLLAEYGDSGMPKEISGKVAAVGRFTMDLTMRDVIRQLSHLPIGHTFFFVVLDFDASVVSESTRTQMEYGRTLCELSERQVNVLEAVGHDVNDKLSLDLKRTGVYFVDELFSFPEAEHQSSCNGISTRIPFSQRPIQWCITELPSGSKALFTEQMMQERLLEEQQEQRQLLLKQTHQEQIQPSHHLWNALQQQILGLKATSERPMPLIPPPGEQRSRPVHMQWGCQQIRYSQAPQEHFRLHSLQSSQVPHKMNVGDKAGLKTSSTRQNK